ncbi:hypothetical protein BpHYR1_011707, partial [Brachionus plicatilis]
INDNIKIKKESKSSFKNLSQKGDLSKGCYRCQKEDEENWNFFLSDPKELNEKLFQYSETTLAI